MALNWKKFEVENGKLDFPTLHGTTGQAQTVPAEFCFDDHDDDVLSSARASAEAEPEVGRVLFLHRDDIDETCLAPT